MDFAVPDSAAAGPSAPAVIRARGADPLIEIPPVHFFHTVSDLPFQPVPGSLTPVLNALPYSVVESILGPMLAVDRSTIGGVHSHPILNSMITPAKFEAALAQSFLEASNVRLDPNARYSSMSAAAAAVFDFACRLDASALHPAYVLFAADVYPTEPVLGSASASYRSLFSVGTAITYGGVADRNGFLSHLAFLGFSMFGRALTSSRDSPASPTRVAVMQIESLATAADLIRSGASITASSFRHWLDLTMLPSGLFHLVEVGVGADRREQCIRDRHLLLYGDVSQKESILAGLALVDPMRTRLPNLTRILGAGCTPVDSRVSILRLVRGVLGSHTADMASVAMLENLEPALKNLIPTLTMPSLVGANLSRRVDAIIRAAGDTSTIASGSATAAATLSAAGTGSSSSIDRAKADIFADELAGAMGQPGWRAVEAQLSAELLNPNPSPLKLHDQIVNSPLLGARRLALGSKDSSLWAVLRLSKPLARALNELEDFRATASLMLVCDLSTMTTTEPNLISFRLSEKTAAALRRGAFDEIDWVADVLVEVMRARDPNVTTDQFTNGLYDPRVPPQLEPLMQRVSRLLGLPLQPPPPPTSAALLPVGATMAPPPPPPLFSSLSQIVTTVAAENLDITGHPSPFDDDYLAKLRLFESTAWREAASEFKQRVASSKNPAGPPLISVLPPNSAAKGILAMMRNTKLLNRTQANMNPTGYAMLADYRAGALGGRHDTQPNGSTQSRASADRNRSRSPDTAHGGNASRATRPSNDTAPGSRVENTLYFSADGSAFWYTQPDTRKRVSPVYDFDTLERIAGKSRDQLDFPVLLSTMPPHKRMTLCAHSHLQHHQTLGSSAHQLPTADFLDLVRQHFHEPAAHRSAAAGATEDLRPPHGGGQPYGLRGLPRGKSPNPNDSRRSHGQAAPPAHGVNTGRPQRSGGPIVKLLTRSASPGRDPRTDRTRQRSRSASCSRSRSPQRLPTDRDETATRQVTTRAAASSAAAQGGTSASPPSQTPASSTEPRASPHNSPRTRGGTSKAQATKWMTGLVATGKSADAALTAPATPSRPYAPPLLSLVAPSHAVVRTILLVVALAHDSPMRLLVPPNPDDVIGLSAARAAPRSAAVATAHMLAAALQLPGVDLMAQCVPIAESVPALGDRVQSVDRVVALPLGPVLARGAFCAIQSHLPGWTWLTLGALGGLAVYAIAALAFARIRSYFPSSSVESARLLLECSSRWRSGAREHREVSQAAARRRSADDAWQQSRPVAASTAPEARTLQPVAGDYGDNDWRHARTRMAAADSTLRRMLLAIPHTDPDAEGLHAFADLLRPLNVEEVPPSFKLQGGLPSFDSPELFLQPFSVRVGPPRTAWLPRRPAQPQPPPGFRPQSIRDLLEPFWFDKLTDWYASLGAWLLDLAEASLAPPDDGDVARVLAARPKVLVIPASGFVENARGTIWDLRRGPPTPADFTVPINTHLNLRLVRAWMTRFPDFPDREIFSHLLDGVRFKTEPATQMVLQPHLSSLSLGFVSVHKELVRLTDKGFFEAFTHPPFAPWVTLPMGVAFRKLEPGRPRRTTDGGAPRKGTDASRFLIDADGVRVLPLNLLARHPPDDIARGTSALFADCWKARLCDSATHPPLAHTACRARTGPRRAPSRERPTPTILLLFAGPGVHPSALSRRLAAVGLDVHAVDILLDSTRGDLSRADVVRRYAAAIANGAYAFVFAAPPCASYSVAVDDSRPQLRSRAQPRGPEPCPPQWRAYLRLHNRLADATLACVFAAHESSVPWAIENPAPRWDEASPAYWPKFSDYGTLWDVLAAAGLAPARLWPTEAPPSAPVVLEATFAACAFGASFQKYTTVWMSHGAASLAARLRNHDCTHPATRHTSVLQGRRGDGSSVAAAAAAYTPELAQAFADGIDEVVYAAAVASDLALAVRSCSPARPTVSSHPAPPALRGGLLVDVDITRGGSTPLLSNPFKLGAAGKDESLRQLAVVTYHDWLELRTVAAGDMRSALPVAASMRSLSGDAVIGEVGRLVSRYGADSAFHLVCGKRCHGKLCHGSVLAALFEQVVDSAGAPPFPKELKPTVPEIMSDLAVLMHLSALTGIPVFQIVSDVKDFFNQHHLAPEEQHKVGLVTLDPRAIVQHAERLRHANPALANIAENVLGYGLACASNICQRTAHLLIFIWLVEMQTAAYPVVRALRRQHPALRRWLDARANRFELHAGSPGAYRSVRYAQARLWVASMYTDDGHQALLGPELTIVGLRTWRRIMSELRLTMAIVQKHGLGQQVTVQGCRFNTGLGIAYVPEDKLRRAVAEIDAATSAPICVREYHSLVSFLHSLTFVVGMSRSASYGLFAPLSQRAPDPDAPLALSDAVKTQLRAWRCRLLHCAGAPLLAAIDHLAGHRLPALLSSAPAVFYLRSDASKDGARLPGLGGALGALLWRYPPNTPLTRAELALPIAVLEFAAYFGTVEVYHSLIAAEALVVSEVDALASADALTAEAARSPLMQHVHTRLLALPAYLCLEGRHAIGHIYGEANAMADAASRGNYATARSLASQLGMALQWRPHGPQLDALMRELVALHLGPAPDVVDALAQTSLGRANLNMTGTPIAHFPDILRLGPAPDAVDALAQTSRGRANLNMTGTPIAHGLDAQHLGPAPDTVDALAQTSRGRANLNMTGTPIAHCPDTIDTSGLQSPTAPPKRELLTALYAATPSAPLPFDCPLAPHPPPLSHLLLLAPSPTPSVPACFAPPSCLAPRPASDSTAAATVAALLLCDDSGLALRPTSYDLRDLCAQLYDPSSAQPARTSAGQDSAWKHWTAWCVVNNTVPWRLTRHASDTAYHREAVLQAGFIRFCHHRQSARPRSGRRAALVSSALKTLCHVRKMHRDRSFPMCPSPLVTAQVRRLMFEYKAAYGVHDMIPKRKEPFTRQLLVDVILATPDGYDTNIGKLAWQSRTGRSVRALVCTLAQAGFRKGEVSVGRVGSPCDADCLSRGSLSWVLRGRSYAVGDAPTALLTDLRPGDFAVLVPCPSKADPFDMVWGGDPIWLPFQLGEPLCACAALADVEVHDPLAASANRSAVAMFTTAAGLPFSDAQLDRLLQLLLTRVLSPATAKLYSWHSARIFLATTLLASGATHPEIQALCRWQTTDSIKIYARLTSTYYARLLDGAMAARVCTARAQNLALAVPFIDLQDIRRAAAAAPPPRAWQPDDADLNVHPDDDADDDAPDTCRDPAPTPPHRNQEARAAAPTATPAVRVCAPPAASPAAARMRASPVVSPPASSRRVRARAAPVVAVECPPLRPASSVAHLHFRFPDNLAGYLTYDDRPSARRPPVSRARPAALA